jgi:hypothetical protein
MLSKMLHIKNIDENLKLGTKCLEGLQPEEEDEIENYELQISPLFNNGRLLSLKVSSEKNQIEFRDSNLLLNMPLKDFNKELGLKMTIGKEI